MNMKQIISTLTAGLLSAVLLAGCTVFVDGDAVTSMDLVDEEGVILSSVSDWTPGKAVSSISMSCRRAVKSMWFPPTGS